MEYIPQHIRTLLKKAALESLNQKEKQALQVWMAAHPDLQPVLDALKDKPRRQADINRIATVGDDLEASYQNFSDKYLIPKRKKGLRALKTWHWAAASIVILLTAGLVFFQQYAGFKTSPDPSILAASPLAEVQLSSGKTIQLGSARHLMAGANQSQHQAVDTSWYQQIQPVALRDSAGQLSPMAFKVVTPKGGKYALGLPDGSKVWMSAASSLSYLQNSKERVVDMQGEIYFEVARQSYKINGQRSWRPFTVHAGGMDVAVWGTKFTVRAYPKSASQTATLYEGKVKVSTGSQHLFLAPGERATLTSGLLRKRSVDNSQGAGLKAGYFIFKAATLKDIMTEVGNWYNVNIVFEDDQIGEQRFEAMLPRSAKLSVLLSAIEGTNEVHFLFKNKTIYVNKH